MSDPQENTTVKYVAELAHVREVVLLGTADLAFWREKLGAEGLFPVERDGKAQLWLGATDAKYMGIKTREFILAVFVCRQEGSTQPDGVYLAQAFNSSRLFAFLERTCFSTPYFHGGIHVNAVVPASMQLLQHGETIFSAAMAAALSGREPLRSGDDGWTGPIFLPTNSRKPNPPRKVFFAKLQGHTLAYAYSPSQDVVTIKPTSQIPVLQWLVDSHFTGQEWHLRSAATHARSKTFSRKTALGF